MALRTEAEDSNLREIVSRQVEQIAKLEASHAHVATKADVEKLRAEMEKLKSDLTWRIVIAMSIMTAIFTAIVRLPASA